LILNSQSPELATRRRALLARIVVFKGIRERADFMHLKRVLILAVLVAAAAILGKAGLHGGGWFNFTW
jgi:hypothetical protein